MKTRTNKTVWITVRNLEDDEIIELFETYDEIFGMYDYTEQITISETTYNKICSGDYFLKRYGNTLRAYSY